jgi:erythromycin esterase
MHAPPLAAGALALTCFLSAAPLGAQEPAEADPEAARAWIARHAIPLTTVRAGHGLADLEPLRRVIGDARIVALGEATHGTKEFFQLKHRMLEFLVGELGFDVFAIEASLPEAMDVNRYVLTGEGDPARALAGLDSWAWNTEEVLELIHWMRRYNANPQHTRKVRFYGFDMQFAPRAARVTLDYLRRVDTATVAASAEAALEPLTNPFLDPDVAFRWPLERRRALLESVRGLAAAFEERRSDYTARSSPGEWDLVRRHLHVLEQALEMRVAARGREPSAIRDAGLVRDSAMAANVAWLLEREGPDSKAVLWAHNLHVATQPGLMGGYLRRTFGEQLRVIGFAFDRGEFQAQDAAAEGKLRDFRVGAAPDGTLDAQLAAAGLELAALDLRAVPPSGPVADWFQTTRRMRSVAGIYADGWGWWPGRVAEAYDALLFVRETSAARPNPSGRPTEPVRLAAPANLDFELGEPRQPPRDWLSPSGIMGMEWEVVLTGQDARQGDQAVVIRRAADGGGYGETYGALEQRIDPTPWRGRCVTLRASVRVAPSAPSTRAFLWLEVTHRSDRRTVPVFYENMADRPITAYEWREYEITADVPEDADAIAFGLAAVGSGPVWLDAVSLTEEC